MLSLLKNKLILSPASAKNCNLTRGLAVSGSESTDVLLYKF